MASLNAQEWRCFVNRILSAWSGYQLAMDLKTGGPETNEKHEWFIDVLAEHVFLTRNLNAGELEEWINHILYTEFDLILEDDSVYPTSSLLVEAFSYYKHNDHAKLSQIIGELPNEEMVKEVMKASQRISCVNEDAEMDEISDEEEGYNGIDEELEGTSRKKQPRTVTDIDGWTTILKR